MAFLKVFTTAERKRVTMIEALFLKWCIDNSQIEKYIEENAIVPTYISQEVDEETKRQRECYLVRVEPW